MLEATSLQLAGSQGTAARSSGLDGATRLVTRTTSMRTLNLLVVSGRSVDTTPLPMSADLGENAHNRISSVLVVVRLVLGLLRQLTDGGGQLDTHRKESLCLNKLTRY